MSIFKPNKIAVVVNDEFLLSCWVIFFDKLKIGLLLDHTKIHENKPMSIKNNLVKPVILSWLIQFLNKIELQH